MGFLDRFRAAAVEPRASIQSNGPGVLITTPDQLEEALRTGELSESGMAVTPNRAMRVAAVYGCVRLLCSPVATLPLDIKRRVDDRVRADASDHFVWALLRRRPNRWQKPHQFKRMLQAHVLLRGNGYAYKVPGVGGRIQELIPLDPTRVETKQLDDYSIVHVWTQKSGRQVTLKQDEVMHLFALTLDGIKGVTPLTYARETIGRSLASEQHVGRVLKKGARHSGTVQTDKALSDKAFGHLKESLEQFSDGGSREGEVMILEEGLKFQQVSMSPTDLQWIEDRKLTRSDIAMFFGVPPSMIGDNSGSDSNWGTGLEQKSNGFVAFTLEDYFTMWEEGIGVDLLDDAKLYARFNRAALVRGDIKARSAAYQSALQWGWMCPDEVRELEDRNPRADGKGGEFYDPPNTAGNSDSKEDDDDQDPPARLR